MNEMKEVILREMSFVLRDKGKSETLGGLSDLMSLHADNILREINQRHEEAMKEMAREAWVSAARYFCILSESEVDEEKYRFEKWYNEKTKSDEY